MAQQLLSIQTADGVNYQQFEDHVLGCTHKDVMRAMGSQTTRQTTRQ